MIKQPIQASALSPHSLWLVLSVLIGSVLVIISGRWLFAEIHLVQVNDTLSNFEVNTDSRNQQNWDDARKKLENALSLHPSEQRLHVAQYNLYRLAFTFPYTFSLNIADTDQFYFFKSQAADVMTSSLLNAAQLSPGSPYSWINLALAKTESSQFDSDLVMAFRNAYNNGGQIETVQRYLAQISTYHTYALQNQSELRSLMLKNLEQALSSSGRSQQIILDILRSAFVLPLFCRHLDLSKLSANVQEVCENALQLFEA